MGAVALLFFILILALPQSIFGISSFIVTACIAGIFWIVYITKYIPRCPKCGYGYFSILEIKRVPVIVASRFSNKCYGCGAKL
jgi:hypothetical protein